MCDEVENWKGHADPGGGRKRGALLWAGDLAGPWTREGALDGTGRACRKRGVRAVRARATSRARRSSRRVVPAGWLRAQWGAAPGTAESDINVARSGPRCCPRGTRGARGARGSAACAVYGRGIPERGRAMPAFGSSPAPIAPRLRAAIPPRPTARAPALCPLSRNIVLLLILASHPLPFLP